MNYRRELQPVLDNPLSKAEEVYQDVAGTSSTLDNLAEDEDIVTEVDRKMTNVVISYLEELDGEYRLESEELNKEDRNVDESGTEYTVILDEIDGTGNMKDYSGSFGPIIGIAEGEDPRFCDVVASGFLDLMRGISYTAYRDEGSYRTHSVEAETRKLEADKTGGLGEQGDLLIDQVMLGKKPDIAGEAWRHWCKDFGCSGHGLAMVAEGSFDAFITGSEGHIKDRKTGEEIGPLFLLIDEAGGVMTDWNGEKIDEEIIGLAQGKGHDVIAAQNMDIAEEIAEDIL